MYYILKKSNYQRNTLAPLNTRLVSTEGVLTYKNRILNYNTPNTKISYTSTNTTTIAFTESHIKS